MTDRITALEELVARGDYAAIAATVESLTTQDIRDGLDRLLDCATRLTKFDHYDTASVLLTATARAMEVTSAETIRIRNHQAVLAAGLGLYAEALAILEDTHIDAGRSNSPLLFTIQANLAVLSLLTGDLTNARKWVGIALESEDPAAAVVVTSVGTAIARVTADHDALALATTVQKSATLDYLARAGDNNPLALAGMTGLLSAEFDLPTSRRSPEHAAAAIDALEITVQRTAAVLGHRHPQTLIAWINLALAEFEVARDRNSAEAMRDAITMVLKSTMRADRVLGYEHPVSLSAQSNLASAQFELARAEKNMSEAATALERLRESSDRTTRVLGADNPQSLVALSNFASAEFELARINGSRDHVEHALESLEVASARSAAVLGNQHPSTLVLQQEMRICQALIADGEPDEQGSGSLLTKLYITTKSDTSAFDDEYISVDDAGAALSVNVDVPRRSPQERPSDDELVREGDIAGDYLELLLDLLDFDGDIDLDVEAGRAVVNIDGGDDLEKLVGPRGNVLEALQELTRLAVQQKTGVPSRLMLDIAGWRADRREELRDLGKATAERVLSEGEKIRLQPMTPFERKVVQDAVAEIEGVDSESEGEDPRRRVVIFPTSP